MKAWLVKGATLFLFLRLNIVVSVDLLIRDFDWEAVDSGSIFVGFVLHWLTIIFCGFLGILETHLLSIFTSVERPLIEGVF